MGNLLKAKLQFKMDKDLRQLLVRGGRDEILLDLDGDKLADLALIDDNRDGDIDTLAIDLTGDGEFNLFFVDTDGNSIPDAVLFDEKGDGNLTLLGLGEEVEAAMLDAVDRAYALTVAQEYAAQELNEALLAIEKEAKAARKELNKRR